LSYKSRMTGDCQVRFRESLGVRFPLRYSTIIRNNFYLPVKFEVMDIKKFFARAANSSFHRTLLNWVLGRMIPFNKPHGFRISEVGEHSVKVLLPYRKRNLNHIKGIHACALATVSEFTTGLLLIRKLDAGKYRLIMKRLEMDYHYQGKTDAYAVFTITEEWMNENVYTPLRTQEAVVVPCEVQIFDVNENLLTTGKVYWQVKDWQKVKTKVNV
jgi:acyl-coenzyme A thioesterase PaaI-like protein